MPPPPALAPRPEALLGPLRRLMRPLIRLLIRSGVGFPAFAELARGLYVDVAGQDLLADPAERTDSRLSLMTGVHRKELRRLREQAGTAEAEPPRLTLASAIIARWLAAHATPAGAPLPLTRAEFDALVRGATRDVRPRAVLDDWLGQGIARLDGEDRIALEAAAFLPRPGGAEQLFYFARNLHDHAAAASANLVAEAPPFLDRAAHYDRLTEETAATIERIGREAAQRMLAEVNRAALALMEANDAAVAREPGAKLHRVNIGAYVFRGADEAGEQR